MERTCPNCWVDFEKNGAWSRLLDNLGCCPSCGERLPNAAIYCELMGWVPVRTMARRVFVQERIISV